jgi:hypothetical protein
MQEAQQQQAMNAQVQQQAALTAEQAKQQTLQAEMTLKAQIVDLEKKYDLAILDKKYQYEIELEKLRSGSKIDVAKVYNDKEPNSAPINLGLPVLPETLQMQQMQNAQQNVMQ